MKGSTESDEDKSEVATIPPKVVGTSAEEIAKVLAQKPLEELKLKTYYGLSKVIREDVKKLQTSRNGEEARKLVNEINLALNVCEDEYRVATETRTRKKKVMQRPHPETAEEVIRQIRGPEEYSYPWMPDLTNLPQLPNERLFMRVVDDKSQARIPPDASAGCLSGGTVEDLKNFEGRRKSLRHLIWRSQQPTVWI